MRITREEETELGRRILLGDASALDALINAYLWIVPRTVGSMHVPYKLREDAQQEGYLGLVEAARRFDPKVGVRLNTYATYWIRMRIRDFVAKERRKKKRMKELDAPCYLHEEDLWAPGNVIPPLSAVIESQREKQPITQVAEKELLERLKAAEAMLPQPLRMILRRRYWTERSVAGQAESIGLSREQLRNMLALTFRFLRRHIDSGPHR